MNRDQADLIEDVAEAVDVQGGEAGDTLETEGLVVKIIQQCISAVH